MKVRRIVNGFNAAGEAAAKTDEQLTAVPRVDGGIKGGEIRSTYEMPVGNSTAADADTGWIGMAVTDVSMGYFPGALKPEQPGVNDVRFAAKTNALCTRISTFLAAAVQ